MNLTKALEWISGMEEVMVVFIMIDLKTVKYVTYLLIGDAKV